MSKGRPQLPRIQPVGRAVASTAWVSNFGPWRSPPLQQIHAAAQARGDRGAGSYSWIRLRAGPQNSQRSWQPGPHC